MPARKTVATADATTPAAAPRKVGGKAKGKNVSIVEEESVPVVEEKIVEEEPKPETKPKKTRAKKVVESTTTDEPEKEKETEFMEDDTNPQPPKPKRTPRPIIKMSDKHKVAVYFGIHILKKLKDRNMLNEDIDVRNLMNELFPILLDEDEAEQGKFFVDLEKTLKAENGKRALAREAREKKQAEKQAEKMRKAAEKAKADAEKRERAAEQKAQKAAERKTKKPATKKEKAIAEVDGEKPAPKKRNTKKTKDISNIVEEVNTTKQEQTVDDIIPEFKNMSLDEENDTEDDDMDNYEPIEYEGKEYIKHKVTNVVYVITADELYEEYGVFAHGKVVPNDQDEEPYEN